MTKSKQHQALAKVSFLLLQAILDSDHPNSVQLSQTQFYLGTDNMDEQQLFQHVTQLLFHYHVVRNQERIVIPDSLLLPITDANGNVLIPEGGGQT